MTSLNIFQIKADITDPDEIVVGREELWSHPVRLGRTLLGMLYAKETRSQPPSWLPYFEDLVDFSGARLRTASAAALLLMKRGERLYVVTFGHGRWLLYEGVIESRFGLKVTLNSIEPTSIRSIDHKRLETVSRSTREQLSRAAGIEHFGLDVERDLLRAVTGTPSDPSLGTRLVGADQLTVIGKTPIRQLASLIDHCAELASQKNYRQHFAWVDNIAELTDADLREELDQHLLARLQAGDSDHVWLAPPEILDWSDVAGFRYRSATNAVVVQDLELPDYHEDCRPAQDLTLKSLRTDRIRCLSAVDGSERQTWGVHHCLVAEFNLDDGSYVLSEGRWYRVDRDFLAEVDQAIVNLPRAEWEFPPYQDASERAYNERVAAQSGGHFAMLDGTLVPSGRRGRIEVCDLFGRDLTLVHVKRYGGSSVLSHLFSQGVVSAELLLSERLFRQAFNDTLPASHQVADPIQPIRASDWDVAYAVVNRRGKDDAQLPFFSKVNLRNAARLLQQWGYGVSLTTISNPG